MGRSLATIGPKEPLLEKGKERREARKEDRIAGREYHLSKSSHLLTLRKAGVICAFVVNFDDRRGKRSTQSSPSPLYHLSSFPLFPFPSFPFLSFKLLSSSFFSSLSSFSSNLLLSICDRFRRCPKLRGMLLLVDAFPIFFFFICCPVFMFYFFFKFFHIRQRHRVRLSRNREKTR